MNIRLGKISDIDSCNLIDHSMGFKTKYEVINRAVSDKRLIVAVKNEKVVGYLRYGYIWDDDLPYIQMIRVVKKLRGKGFGTKLIAFLESILIKKQSKRLCSSTDESNHDSLKFHNKLGFVECGTLNINDDGKREIFLVKALES